MSLPQSLRALRQVLARAPRPRNPHRQIRFESNQPTRPTKPTTTSSTTTTSSSSSSSSTMPPQTRLDRLIARTARYLPARLQRPLRNFRDAPVSHVAAFLVLHELTAILPIFGLVWAFRAFDIVPSEYVFGPWAPYVQERALKALAWVRRKGLFGLSDAGAREGEARFEEEFGREAEREREEQQRHGRRGWLSSWGRRRGDDEYPDETTEQTRGKLKKAAALVKEKATLGNAENGYKLSVQLVAAYAITKALLIPRIAFTLFITPSTARAMIWARKTLFGW